MPMIETSSISSPTILKDYGEAVSLNLETKTNKLETMGASKKRSTSDPRLKMKAYSPCSYKLCD